MCICLYRCDISSYACNAYTAKRKAAAIDDTFTSVLDRVECSALEAFMAVKTS